MLQKKKRVTRDRVGAMLKLCVLNKVYSKLHYLVVV